MTKRNCEKCRKKTATVKCNLNGGSVWWWFCEPCFKDKAGESSTEHVEIAPQGFPEASSPSAPTGYPFIPFV